MHLERTITIRLDLNRHDTWILSTLDQNPRIISMAAGKRRCGVAGGPMESRHRFRFHNSDWWRVDDWNRDFLDKTTKAALWRLTIKKATHTFLGEKHLTLKSIRTPLRRVEKGWENEFFWCCPEFTEEVSTWCFQQTAACNCLPWHRLDEF